MEKMNNTIAFLSQDRSFGTALVDAAQDARQFIVSPIDAAISGFKDWTKLENVSLIIVDLDANDREQLVGLQNLMSQIRDNIPVIVLTGSFDDAVARWFLQIRVSDFLRKPVTADALLEECVKTLQALNGESLQQTRIVTFVAAAGGVGNTTMAVESAMQYTRAGVSDNRGVCLVDLDFENDACASYLDIEPRLDVLAICEQEDQLDDQLLEVMTSRHKSGLSLLAAPARPGEKTHVSREVICKLLDIVSMRYAIVVIDLPRAWHAWTDDILCGSDQVFVVTDVTVPGLRCGRRMVTRIQDRLGDASHPKVIVNRFEKQGFFSSSGLRQADVERVLEGSFAGMICNNYPVVREAIDRGVPLETVKQGNSVTQDLRRIIFE